MKSLTPSQNVAVLGAGRLLDLDLSAICAQSECVSLFDGDRGCRAVWRAASGAAFGRSVLARIEDVTGALSGWNKALKAHCSESDLGSFLRSLRAPRPTWSREPFDTIISLNLLGQIPLYWRDSVRAAKKQLSDTEEEALDASMGELQRAHLEGLITSGARRVIAIFDTEYYFYQASACEWRVEPALRGDAAQSMKLLVPGRMECAQDSWLWHVAPHYVEQDDEGEIHRVEAYVWDKR